MLELLCFKHYQERINNGTNQEAKETTIGSTKSYSKETKEKERKVKCRITQEATVKGKNLNLL